MCIFCTKSPPIPNNFVCAKDQGEGELLTRTFADRMVRRGIRKKATKTGKRWLGIDITPEYRAELQKKGLPHG